MASIVHIATAVPDFPVEAEESARFFAQASDTSLKKILFLSSRTKIIRRYSCIPDYKGGHRELYTEGNYRQSIEKRMQLYKRELLPLAAKAVDSLLRESGLEAGTITHIITVSCTGMMAPGFEFLLAEAYGLEHTEKTALNFLGCYAGLKALKQAVCITDSKPNACILIVCAELCSLHYHPPAAGEDLVPYLLFGDGAAAAVVCADDHPLLQGRSGLQISQAGSGFIPGTAHLMTWEIGSEAFRMHLGNEVVQAIKDNIAGAAKKFLGHAGKAGSWAIHPGGIKIVEAVQQELKLSAADVADSLYVMKHYGNMSSATILFILQRILNRFNAAADSGPQTIFSCAFGPGLNIEMMLLSWTGRKAAQEAGGQALAT